MEKRKYQRTPLSLEVKVDGETPGRLLDISSEGMRLESRRIPAGEKVGIWLPSGARSLPVFGQVRWSKPVSPSTGVMGVQIRNAPYGFQQFMADVTAFRRVENGFLFWPLILTASFFLLLLVLI